VSNNRATHNNYWSSVSQLRETLSEGWIRGANFPPILRPPRPSAVVTMTRDTPKRYTDGLCKLGTIAVDSACREWRKIYLLTPRVTPSHTNTPHVKICVFRAYTSLHPSTHFISSSMFIRMAIFSCRTYISIHTHFGREIYSAEVNQPVGD
jgi:hypothetical protein